MQNNPMFAPGFAWKRSKSIVALVTLVAFTVTTLVWDPSAFAGTGVPAAGEVSVFSREVLRIPAELGQVTETLMGDPKAPAFIHIQSAHGNYSAEKNIEKLLKFIEKNSSVKLMLLEGASGKLRPEMFRVFPAHPEFNQKVTDKLAREGYLTGPERFLVEDGTRDVARVEGYGIEDLASYKKDREAFIRVMRANGSAEKYVASLRASIDQRYSMKLGKDLLNLVRQEEAFGSGTVSFEGWLAVLKAASRKHLALDLSDAFYQDRYPHLIRYYRLREIGSKIDRKAAMNELDLFIKELEKRKIAKETIELFEQVGAEGARPLAWGVPGSMKSAANRQAETRDAAHARGYSPTRRAFDLAFEELPKDFSMKPWPHLKLYAQHTIFMEELEAKGLRDEMTRLKDDIYGSLAKTEAEKAYVREARDLYLSRKLFSLELTRSEYEELVRSKARGARGNDKAREVAIEKLYDAAMDFYKTAISRERYMFQNALKKMAATKQQHAVIVTGGFHTEGLKELAKEKNASYLQITPRINEVSKNDHEVYLRSIMGSRDVETSQMSALLGIVDRAQRVTVTGLTATQDWANDVRRLILGMITTEPVDLQPVLAREFSGSVFSNGIPQVVSLPAPADSSVVKVSSEMSPELAKQSRAELRQD